MRVAKFASFCVEVYRSAVDERLFLLGILGQPSTGILFLWEISTVMGYWRAHPRH